MDFIFMYFFFVINIIKFLSSHYLNQECNYKKKYCFKFKNDE